MSHQVINKEVCEGDISQFKSEWSGFFRNAVGAKGHMNKFIKLYSKQNLISGLFFGAILILLYQNCTSSFYSNSSGVPSTTSQNTTANLLPSTQISLTTTSLSVDDIIRTKTVNGRGVFYLSSSGATFNPRGVNYVRLSSTGNHELFEPGAYNASNVQSALEQIHSSGYNYVRVFLEGDSLGKGFGLSKPGVSGSTIADSYFNNLADFIQRAGNLGLRVMLTGKSFPINYNSIVGSYTAPANVSGYNLLLMHPGYVKGYAQFYSDLLTALKTRDAALLSTVFAFDIRNEADFTTTDQPLSLHSGTVTVYGVNYDMSNLSDRQKMMNATAVEWFTVIRNAIKSVSQDVLVSTSTFSPYDLGRKNLDGADWNSSATDPSRVPVSTLALADSAQPDYIDFHAYPTRAYSMTDDLASIGITSTTKLSQPLIMGEFGSFKSVNPTIAEAAAALKLHLSNSCNFGFTGWAFWTWDTSEQADIWTASESSGAMNGVVAPIVLPDVCPQTTSTTGTSTTGTSTTGTSTTGTSTTGTWTASTSCSGTTQVVSYSCQGGNSQCATSQPANSSIANSAACGFVGRFMVGQGIFYSNGQGHYCMYKSWDYYLNTCGFSYDTSSLQKYSSIPTGITYDGTCVCH